jgi:hypothetical protein
MPKVYGIIISSDIGAKYYRRAKADEFVLLIHYDCKWFARRRVWGAIISIIRRQP